MIECCKEMEEAVSEKVFRKGAYKAKYYSVIAMTKQAEKEGDEDEYSFAELKFCPFCGKELPINKNGKSRAEWDEIYHPENAG